MSSGTLILDVRRAQAEAARKALSSWEAPDDPVKRADEVEGLVRELLNTPRELRTVVNRVIDNLPKDGTILAYMNRQRLELHALFDSALAELRQICDLARECIGTGQKVPSLPALEKAIQEAEQAREDTLAHWTEFPEGPIVIRPEEYISNEEAFAIMFEGRSPECLRELQNRLEQLDR
jgi:hypothetical protein